MRFNTVQIVRSLGIWSLTIGLGISASGAFADPKDYDGDGVKNLVDNCCRKANPDQKDVDNDGFGNMCDADYDNDGVVAGSDFSLLGAGWKTFAEDEGEAFAVETDCDSNGVIWIEDYNLLVESWGGKPGPSGLASFDDSIDECPRIMNPDQ